MAEQADPVARDDAWLPAALNAGYHAVGARLEALAPLAPKRKRLYRVLFPDRAPWLLRVAPPASPAGTWRADAAVLDVLQQRAYRAPRVVRTAAGAPVLHHERALLFATTFIAGTALDATPASQARLGQAVGRLHALPVADLRPPLRSAGMLPRNELAFARRALAAIDDRVPAALTERYRALAAACKDDDWADGLPAGLLHNDCHPGNAVQLADGAVVLVDWEGAGLGPAIIDLAFLLVSVALPLPRGWDGAAPPLDWRPPPPDLHRLEGVLEGYARERTPSPAELDCLPRAMRFRSLVAAACAFASQVRLGLTRDPAPWWWWRCEAAAALAGEVRRRLTGSG